jgi:urease accessory protein
MRTRTRTELRSSHLRSFVLGGDRVALVPEQAVLLAGDHVTVDVRVAAGTRLEIVEPGGTVAYAMRGGQARWEVTVEVEDGGRLVWRGEPFVVAAGADVRRTTHLDLAGSGAVALRETLVLGRSGEPPGRLLARTEVRRDGTPVLVEELDSRVGLGRHRVLDQALHLGGPAVDEAVDEAMVLDSGDRLQRWLGDQVHRSPITM